MTHEEKRLYLIKTLLAEQPRYRNIEIPAEEQAQKDLLRSLMNVVALAIVFFTRKIVPLPFYATIIATATGLAFGNVFFTWLLTKEMKKDMEAAAQQKADSEGGE